MPFWPGFSAIARSLRARVNYSISSACATSNHCIGNAYEMIQYGKQDVMFAGGCEELDRTLSVFFDAMGAFAGRGDHVEAVRSQPIAGDFGVNLRAAGLGALIFLKHQDAGGRSTISTRTRPRRASATSRKSKRSAPFSAPATNPLPFRGRNR